MIRLLNLLALIAVISSATWAYSVKYETILVAETLRKREVELTRERDAVAILQAEWHLFNRPERLQSLAKPESGMGTVSAKQIAKPADIPQATPAKGDVIDSLLTGSIPTPDSAKKAASKSTGTTPSAASKTGKATTPASANTTGKTTAQAKSSAQAKAANPAKSTGPAKAASGPVRLIPPAKVGASAPAVAASAPEPKSSNPLTGFLKKLIQ